MISKGLRFLGKISSSLSNSCRKSYLRLKYPGLKVDRYTVIKKNCSVICIDGGKLEINNSFISEGVLLVADSQAKLLINHAFIGRYSCIVSKAAITIEHGVSIAEMVVIRDQDHVIHPDLTSSKKDVYQVAPIHIGKNSWIASKATVLKGVTIGDHAIVAASAVVTKSVPAGEVWGGIPAKFIKKITDIKL